MKNNNKTPKEKLSFTFNGTLILFRSIPSIVVALFVISVIAMNILANKTLVQTEYLAIDGGILISWLSFLCMDLITKHFGPKASNKISIFAILTNLLVCLIFYIVSIIPSEAADYTAFNTIIGGTWFILLSSTIAFISSSLLNNFLNFTIGKMFKNNPDGRLAFFTRSYVSTFIGQFVDNLIFAIITFMFFAPIYWDGFSWTFIQCVTCSLIGATLETVLGFIFTPIAYRVSLNWKKNNVGKDYFEFINKEETV